MRRASIIFAVLATTLAGRAPLAQAQESSAPHVQAQGSSAPQAQAKKGPTVGGHIGFVLPLVTRSGGQTTSLADQFAVGFPVGITVKGSGRTAFDQHVLALQEIVARAGGSVVPPSRSSEQP